MLTSTITRSTNKTGWLKLGSIIPISTILGTSYKRNMHIKSTRDRPIIHVRLGYRTSKRLRNEYAYNYSYVL